MKDDTQLMVKAAQLYYEEDVTQDELSKILMVSRPTVSRLLKKAREEGIVNIVVNDPISKDHELSSQLRKLFGLRDAVVISGSHGYERAMERCSEAATQYMDAIMEDGFTVGITWGTATQEFCNRVKPHDYKDVTVVQMVGCLGTNIPDVDGSRLVIELSKKYNGTYYNVYSPIYVRNQSVRDYLSDEPAIKETLALAMHTDVVITGIGSFDTSSTIFKAGYWNEPEMEAFISLGAVGHVLGRPYDQNGAAVEREGLYIVGAPFESLRRAKWSIGISASAIKASSVLGAINGGYINVLIADRALAKALIRLKS